VDLKIQYAHEWSLGEGGGRRRQIRAKTFVIGFDRVCWRG